MAKDINLLLINAADDGDVEAVKELLQKGADPNSRRTSALIFAAEMGHVEVIKLLYDAGADIHINNESPLHKAILSNKYESVYLLLKLGADLLAIPEIQFDSLKAKPSIFKLLVEYGLDIHWGKGKPLFHFIEENNAEMVSFLLSKGADAHIRNDGPLMEASLRGYLGILKVLKTYGLDLNLKDSIALRLAASNGHAEVVKFLIDNGADVHANNDSALRNACLSDHQEVIKILLQNGASPFSVFFDDNKKGITNLLKASPENIEAYKKYLARDVSITSKVPNINYKKITTEPIRYKNNLDLELLQRLKGHLK